MRACCLSFLFILVFIPFSFTQNRISLDHTVYDNWNDIKQIQLHPTGRFVSYKIEPQQGDAKIVIVNTENNSVLEIDRGQELQWDYNAEFAAIKVSPEYDTIRKCKIAKIKEDEYPYDSLFIWFSGKNTIVKYEAVKSFKLPKKSSGWIAYLNYEDSEKSDSTNVSIDSLDNNVDTLPKPKYKGGNLFVSNFEDEILHQIPYCDQYEWAEEAASLAYTRHWNFEEDSVQLVWYNGATNVFTTLVEKKGEIKGLKLNKSGNKLAFLFTNDTVEDKHYQAFYVNFENNKQFEITDSLIVGIPDNWICSSHTKFWFSDDDERLFLGTSKPPLPEITDTIPEDEIAKLDIWNYQDNLLQTSQLQNLEDEKSRSYIVVYSIKKNKAIQLADSTLESVSIRLKGCAEKALGYTNAPYYKQISWMSDLYRDYYIVNVNTGERKLCCKECEGGVYASPDANSLVRYQKSDSIWYAYTSKKEQWIPLTNKINVPFYNDLHDTPNLPGSFGIAGFTSNSKAVLIYDKFDIWYIPLYGNGESKRLTSGRENSIRFRILKLDKDEEWVRLDDNIILSGFNLITKASGYYKLTPNGSVEPLVEEDMRFFGLTKADNVEDYIFRKSDFSTFPDIYFVDSVFSDASKISNANPQMDNYLWGDVQLYSWVSAQGDSLSGLLYTPEGFSYDKKYPMIVYFYERYSDLLHSHYSPKPSRSVISFPFYTSNGYVIFIPDIVYRNGEPGASAVDAVVSGTLSLVQEGFIDKNRIGLQGQSWGGYQVAYIVTQTDLFACAMAGAPVSNMTSAYGGIRWGSGNSRMMQYEDGQSRIGGTLWNKRDEYIRNSPIFFADNVNTPLLIMHNDNDGAVPWYQGIEYFLALRRLEKPVWLLNYNGDSHNLKRRANCKDLSIRMEQFFNYYLKDSLLPKWMGQGIPAKYKGIDYGFELLEPKID
jgi:dipeptidyl aminopeptidase/acylaminoacyl peptidase